MLLCLVLVAAGIACAAAEGSPDPSSESVSASSEWPALVLDGPITSFARNDDPEFKVQARSGPGRAYVGVGVYKIKKAGTMKLLFREGGFAYIDMQYPGVGRRCLYLLAGTLSRNTAAEMGQTGIPAQTTENVIPYYGPGKNYDSFEEATIGSGTQVTVFFETDGWLFSEFNCGLGLVRAWLPAGQVSAK